MAEMESPDALAGATGAGIEISRDAEKDTLGAARRQPVPPSIAAHFAPEDLEPPATETRIIHRSDGARILVDAADYARLNAKRWFPSGPDGRYAGRSEMSGGVTRRTYIHRELMAPPPGMVVDHINGDPLDNRRCNLRLASRSQNAANRAHTQNPTGYFGVCADPANGRFQAGVMLDGARFRGPWRRDPETAARDYDRLARGIHGEFATLNFPTDGERGIQRPKAGAVRS